MAQFNLKSFLKENGLTSKEVCAKTGYNKNTFTNWMKLDDDYKLPQDFILKLLKEYPQIFLIDYFPTHAEIIKLSRHN